MIRYNHYWQIPPSSLIQIVVVGLNYRVASLGFLYLGEEGVGGNAGLLDQVEGGLLYILYLEHDLGKRQKTKH